MASVTLVTDAEEALRATERKANFQRLTRLLMCGGVRMLREKFDSIHPPTDLPLTLDDSATRDSLKTAKLFKAQWDCLYPSPGTFGKSTDFDITLIFRLFRTICNLTEPVTKWDNPPSSTDHSLEADLVRIKEYRNSVHGHSSTMEITGFEFRHLWKEISEALLRIAGSMSVSKRDEWKKAINKLLNDPLTPEAQRYVDELQIWYKNDMELKDAVKQLEDQVRQGNEDIRDQLQHFNDQLQQINQRPAIDHDRIPHIVIVVTPILLPMVATSAMAAASESMVTVPINEEKPQCDRQDPQTESYIWRVILSPALSRLQSVLDYFKVQLGVSTVDCTVGSLIITVTCNSIQILKGLWEDYSSGHLNRVIEQILVTPDVLEKLGLSELKLKTTISEEEYKKCKEFFLTEDQSYETREIVEEEEELLQLRNELMNYDFQECPRINKEAFQDLEVDDIHFVRIVVMGPVGTGKTSFVGTLQRALKESQTASDPDLYCGRVEGTRILEEHYLQKNIRMVDTRGFSVMDEELEDEMLDIMFGRLRPGEEIVRSYDREGDRELYITPRRDKTLSECVHSVIFVVNGNDLLLMDGKYRDKLQNFREFLNKEGYVPVSAITFLDKPTLKEKDAAFKMAQRTIGSSNQTTFFVTNYTTREHDRRSEVDWAALNVLDSALVSAERFIQFRRQREKETMAAEGDPKSVQHFLARLVKKYNWNQERKKDLLTSLNRKEIHLVEDLKALWEDIKSKLQLTIGMKIGLETELKRK